MGRRCAHRAQRTANAPGRPESPTAGSESATIPPALSPVGRPPYRYLIARLANVLLEELELAPTEQLYLPLPASNQLRTIARALAQAPSNRATMASWARHVAMSERSLARLIKSETGLTFGQWRKQWQIIVALQSLAEGQSVQRTAEALACSTSIVRRTSK
ncbi:transcriptional regulator [Pseudomonas brassicacearum]|nr:transcriptional regulator [Pseudomonas brassicacearum]